MGWFRRSLLCALVVASALAGEVASAQESGRIREIVVQGAQRIEAETVRSYMALAEGDAFDPAQVDRSLKNLFATGLFADVSVQREGDVLVVRVVENPVINRIAFEGNRRIKSETIQNEIQLRPRVVYTRTKVQNDVRRILDVYRRSGRFAATVEPKLIQLEQNRIDLVFEIDEGPTTKVKGINLIGNRAFGDSRLRDVLQTKEERWYRFFTQDDTYDPDRINYDRELLRRYYLRNGYADFSVSSVVAELTPDREGFIITFTLDEGERYKFGDIAVKTTLPELNVEDLQSRLTVRSGDWYNAEQVETDIQLLTEAVGNLGYAFVDIRPRIERDRAAHTVALTYDIQEGPRVFVDRIEIGGNLRTLDKVIRREFRLVEGDAFNAAKLRRSRQRIRDINFFEKVEVTTVPSDVAPDRTVIKVDVEEKSTGELSFGVGWSSLNGAMFEVGARERNLLGRGQDLRLRAMLAQRQSQVDIGFTEPYFLDRQLAAGFDIFSLTRKLQDESSYDASSTGASLRTGFHYNENWSQDLKYTLKRDNVENIDAAASLYIQQQQGTSVTSSIAQTLTFDRRDSRLNPTEGFYVRLNNELAGFGGTERFLRTNLNAGKYINFGEEYVLGFTVGAGYILGIGDDVRITNRYFLGGDSLRGFETAGVSPRDQATTDALGGLWMYSGSVEMYFPLGFPKELGVTGKVFSDFGSIGPTEDASFGPVDESSSIRLSLGAGVTWRSPLGPINLDFGVPLVKQAFDKTEFFRFNFGTRF